jgi:hypothetical protein
MSDASVDIQHLTSVFEANGWPTPAAPFFLIKEATRSTCAAGRSIPVSESERASKTGVAGLVFKITLAVVHYVEPLVADRLRHFDPIGTELLVKPGRVNHSLQRAIK